VFCSVQGKPKRDGGVFAVSKNGEKHVSDIVEYSTWSLNFFWGGGGMVIHTQSFKKLASIERACAGILEQSMGARKPVGTELSYWQARLHRLYE